MSLARPWRLALALLAAVAVPAAMVAAVAVLTAPPSQRGGRLAAPPRLPLPPAMLRVCGQAVLRSPYRYDGRPGPYRSGTAGLPTYGGRRSDFPHDTAGMVLPAGPHSYLSYQLAPRTVYYLLPGTHVGGIQADRGDAFVGGRAGGRETVLSGGYARTATTAIDSNPTIGDQPGVMVEYLTIEKYTPGADAAAVNQEANTGWTIRYDTITRNVPGAGLIAGSGNRVESDCLTQNGQYGFQSTDVDGFGADPLTGGPYGVTVTGNEISYNDTCDFSGLLRNPAIGWRAHDPVPVRYRNPHCGSVTGDGDQGGFKLWRTNGVTIRDNSIHGNWGVGAWADTGNANTTITGNTITGNEGAGIIEEISYNFAVTRNYLAGNAITDGLANRSFPSPAIYISESGSDTTFGGIPACAEPACRGQGAYQSESVIRGNTLVNNGGNIFLWQNSNRYCSDGFDGICTWVKRGGAGPFTLAACKANLPRAAVSAVTFSGEVTGSPAQNWWDGCRWRTENVSVTHNVIDFQPSRITHCGGVAWPDCGAGGIFSEYGSPPGHKPGWVTATQLTFFQHDTWSDNTYSGPSTFYAWNQGNGDNPVSWADWTGRVAVGDRCSSPGERRSGFCTGPFGQDAGSTYDPR